MKQIITLILIVAFSAISVSHAQLKLRKALGAGVKVVKAATITDEQMAEYVREHIEWLDNNNPVCEGEGQYAVRLAGIIRNIDLDGLNIKAYRVIDVNAFACPDGSIRVFAGLMDIMTDEEILGVIGHEIGHIKNSDSKDAFRISLLASALRDGLSAAGGNVAKLSDSQLGELGEAIANSTFSQKQENAADDFGYNFLKAHNENSWAMALSFEKLQEMQAEMGADKSNAIQQLFSTHPDLENRINKMIAKAEADGLERPEMTAPNTQTTVVE